MSSKKLVEDFHGTKPISLLAKGAIFAIRVYKKVLSPLKSYGTCRFVPTCSCYGIEAIRAHGVGRGSMKLLWRILRCHPFAKAGYDPVRPSLPNNCEHESKAPRSTRKLGV